MLVVLPSILSVILVTLSSRSVWIFWCLKHLPLTIHIPTEHNVISVVRFHSVSVWVNRGWNLNSVTVAVAIMSAWTIQCISNSRRLYNWFRYSRCCSYCIGTFDRGCSCLDCKNDFQTTCNFKVCFVSSMWILYFKHSYVSLWCPYHPGTVPSDDLPTSVKSMRNYNADAYLSNLFRVVFVQVCLYLHPLPLVPELHCFTLGDHVIWCICKAFEKCTLPWFLTRGTFWVQLPWWSLTKMPFMLRNGHIHCSKGGRVSPFCSQEDEFVAWFTNALTGVAHAPLVELYHEVAPVLPFGFCFDSLYANNERCINVSTF